MRKLSVKRKSIKRKSVKRKSVKRKSVKRKSGSKFSKIQKKSYMIKSTASGAIDDFLTTIDVPLPDTYT